MYSLGLLRVVTSCYIFRIEKVCQTSFQVHFCISFQLSHSLLYIFIALVTCCQALLPVVTSLEEKNVCETSFHVSLLYYFPTHEYPVTYVHWACYVLLRVVTSCYIFRTEKVCQTSFQVHFLYLFPTHEYLVTIRSLGLLPVVTRCYQFYKLLSIVTSLEEKRFRQKRFFKLVSRFNFYISFHFTNILLKYVHWASYVLLFVVTSCYIFRGENICQIRFHVLFLYQFPSHQYLAIYIDWACYVLLPVVASSKEKKFVKLVSWFYFCISFQPQNTLLHKLIGLVTCCYTLSVVPSCYIFRREKVSQTSFQVHFCISFQASNALLHMFIRLVTCCYVLLSVLRVVCYLLSHFVKRKGLSNQFPASLLNQFLTPE